MSFFRRNQVVTNETNEIAQAASHAHTPSHLGNWITALASAVALIFSAVSLYHSVLKQPELQFYVSPVVHYTRDTEGNYEVFAIPLTIANHGARDGTVLSIDLAAQNSDAKSPDAFYSAYVVDGSYFVKPARFNRETRTRERVDRPKKPFAPISVPGRSSYSGTILFYKKSAKREKVVHAKGDFKLTLSLNTRLDKSLGILDALLQTSTKPITFTTRLNYFSENRLLTGGTHRLYNIDWQAPVAETITKRRHPSQK